MTILKFLINILVIFLALFILCGLLTANLIIATVAGAVGRLEDA